MAQGLSLIHISPGSRSSGRSGSTCSSGSAGGSPRKVEVQNVVRGTGYIYYCGRSFEMCIRDRFAVCFIYYNYNFAKAGAEEHFEKGNDVYKFYCGKYVGTFMDYYSTIFCYMSFFVMVGGAASTLNQQYGLPSWVGGVVLTALAILTVVGGLNSLVDKIGVVGPAIVVLCIGIGVVTLFRDAGNVGAGLEVIRTGAFAEAGSETIKNAGPNWVISALSYAAVSYTHLELHFCIYNLGKHRLMVRGIN